MRNIHELNAALFDSQYEVVHENGYLTIYDRSQPQGFQIQLMLTDSEVNTDILWFIIDNCTISRKEK